MKKNDLIILGAAGAAALVILKMGGVNPIGKLKQWQAGLSYIPPAGYGNTSAYDNYPAQTVIKEGWGIE